MITQRPMSPSEREQLTGVLNMISERGRKWRQALENAFVMWAVLTLGVVLLWGLLGRWVGPLFGGDFGWNSPAALWIAAAGVVICAFIASISTYRWMSSRRDLQPGLTADVRDAVVNEHPFRLIDAKCFQEPEHHGLIYFLRTDDRRVFVLYDSESQDLAMEGKDPFSGSLKPRAQLRLVRAPASRYVLATTFEGDELERGEPVELCAPPDEWPEDSEFCNVPWDELERRFGPPAG